MLLLVALLGLIYGYWHLTNDRRVRQQAEAYLHDLTGGPVRVGHARFSLFGGIELQNVRLFVPGDDSPEPYLSAPKVILRHYPWGLFLTGSLQPTELIVPGATITLEYKIQDPATGDYTMPLQKMFMMAQGPSSAGGQGGGGALPLVVFRGCRLRAVQSFAGLRQPLGEETVNISMVPRGPSLYTITFEQEHGDSHQATIHGSLSLNLATGERLPAGTLPLQGLDAALPMKYRHWRQLYSLQGRVDLKDSATTAAGTMQVRLELLDVSLKLPESQGGLELASVNGTLVLDLSEDGGITIEKITGRLPQCGDARFELSGRYGGYDKDSPFDLAISAWGVQLPKEQDVTGGVAEAVGALRRNFDPSGKIDVSAGLHRKRGGDLKLTGAAEPQKASFCYSGVPYRLQEVTGRIAFGDDGITLHNIVGHRNGATVTITGRQTDLEGYSYDITVDAKDVLMDGDLYAALPPRSKPVWDALSPSGRGDAVIRALRAGADSSQDVRLKFNLGGKTSVSFKGFPYRLEALTGSITVEDGKAVIDGVTASRGGMQCRATGQIAFDRDITGVDMALTMRDMPLDDALAKALTPRGRELLDSLHVAGAAKLATATLKQDRDGPLQWEVLAALDGVSLKPDFFPYVIDGVTGSVRIRPDSVVLEGIEGRHGDTAVAASGEVGLAMQPRARLLVTARSLALDKDLYAALPADVRSTWDRINPQGSADMSLDLRRGEAGELDYTLALQAKGASIRHSEFPYPLGDITGKVVVTPRKIELHDLLSRQKDRSVALSGTIADGKPTLSVDARNVPIDQMLMDALPADFAALRQSLRPGGTVDVRLQRLELTAADPATAAIASAPATMPSTRAAPAASAPASGPTTGPSRWSKWALAGEVSFKDAVVDAGLGVRTITGGLAGKASGGGAGIAVDADVTLASMVLAGRELTDLRAHLAKGASSPLLRVENLIASTYKGLLTGFAELRLVEPMEYGLSLSVSGVDLREFVATGTAATDSGDIKGKLAAKLNMIGVAGQPAATKGAGEIQIAEASIYKLPVLLGLLNVVFLNLPGESAYQQGTIIYRLSGSTLTFDEIHFTGQGTSLVGSGTMDTRNEALKLAFLAGPAGKMPRLSKLSEDLLGGLLRQMVQIEVSGTVAQPRVRTVSLDSLQKIIRTLTTPQ